MAARRRRSPKCARTTGRCAPCSKVREWRARSCAAVASAAVLKQPAPTRVCRPPSTQCVLRVLHPTTYHAKPRHAVFVTKVDPNYGQPWQKCPQRMSTGSAFVLDTDRRLIMTNAHVVGLWRGCACAQGCWRAACLEACITRHSPDARSCGCVSAGVAHTPQAQPTTPPTHAHTILLLHRLPTQ